MQITYGICVSPDYNQAYLDALLESIVSTHKWKKGNEFELLLIGGTEKGLKESLSYRSDTIGALHRCIDFDEARPGWITRKKNILAQEAKYENLCLMHDYVFFSEDWYQGVKNTAKLDPGWQVMLNRVKTAERTRGPDWLVDPKYMLGLIETNPEYYTKELMALAPHENGPQYVSGLPYSIRHLNHIQYVSGAFFLVKRKLLLDNPFNESMIWGDAPGEDVEWSRRINEKCVRYTWNDNAGVRFQKPNKWHLYQVSERIVNDLSLKYGRT